MPSSLVLLSGGLDSTCLVGMLLGTGFTVEAVSVEYGQRHNKEVESAAAVAGWYGIRHTVLDLSGWGSHLDSALTSGQPVPEGHYTAESMAATVVPNRNATLLMAAAGVAASRGISHVATAVHAGDHAIYPDCRPEFIASANQTARLGCGVGVEAPFARLDKADVVAIGAQWKVPFELTWSCYQGHDVHCGRCGTCVERAEAFVEAGVPDPTAYEDDGYWRTVT